jgi:predicted small secreted protein
MKRIFLLVVALLLSAVTASAMATVQKWTAGWGQLR